MKIVGYVVYVIAIVLMAEFFLIDHAFSQDDLTPYDWHSESVILNKDFEKVVSASTKFDDYQKLLPYVDYMKILSRRGTDAIIYFEHLALGKTFWMKVKFKTVENTDKIFVMKTTYLDGNAHPYESVITIEKISEQKTKVVVKMRVLKPEVYFVPDTIINRYLGQFLKKSLRNLEKFTN